MRENVIASRRIVSFLIRVWMRMCVAERGKENADREVGREEVFGA
jgi:hypothetical protein